MPIKHIVLCGGGPIGLVSYGALKELNIKKVWRYKNIKSVYATSIGSFIALIILLNYEWSWMDDFLIKRPWEKLINFSSYDYLNLIYEKGMVGEDFIKQCIEPLLSGKNLNIDITLKEFFNITNIDLHMFTSNITKFCKVDLNHQSYPDLKLYQAIWMSSCIPVVFKPPYYKEEYYLDGAIFVNAPINDCFFTEKCKKSEILLFVNDKRWVIEKPIIDNSNPDENTDKDIMIDSSNNLMLNSNELTQDSNLFSFLIFTIKTILRKMMIIENENNIQIKNTINCCTSENTIDLKYWIHVFSTADERECLIRLGEQQATKFIEDNVTFNKNKNKHKNIVDISDNLLDTGL